MKTSRFKLILKKPLRSIFCVEILGKIQATSSSPFSIRDKTEWKKDFHDTNLFVSLEACMIHLEELEIGAFSLLSPISQLSHFHLSIKVLFPVFYMIWCVLQHIQSNFFGMDDINYEPFDKSFLGGKRREKFVECFFQGDFEWNVDLWIF